MATNTREEILKHEQSPAYLKRRPEWVVGRVLGISDYRKITVEDNQELMTLAQIGQLMADQVVPGTKLYFTQAVLVGAALLDRPLAEKFGLEFEKYRSVLMVTPTRYGKLEHNDTPVLTTKGWKKHGDLHPGDVVFHPSGEPTVVVAETPEMEVTHKITFQNGETLFTHANHEWYVYDRTMRKTHRVNGKKIVNSYGGYRIMETQELASKRLQQEECNKLRDKTRERNKYYVDAPQPCQFMEQKQILDPYFLGCWLGDGSKNKPVLTLSPEKAKHILPHIPFKVTRDYKYTGCSAYEFRHQDILAKLHEIDVFKNKHIPDCYKYASQTQQKALLAGLVDTDGYVDKNGRVVISCANEKLKDDIVELLTVMGQCPCAVAIPPTTSSSGIAGKKTVYNISFQPSYELPTHHKKITRIVPHQRIGITKIEEVHNAGKGKCIQVDSPDGLYLVGKSLIPTHNSFLNAFIAIANAALGNKEVRIGGATKDKAGLIQEKIVELMPKTTKEIQNGLIVNTENEDVNKKVQRLATQVSKEALAWKGGGSIKLFSTNETKKNADVAAAGAVGVGGDVVILDEIQLMTPMGFRTASRFFMENNDTKRFCVGNPQRNGHFRDLYDDPNTFVVHLNDSGAVIEGRMSRRQMELTGMPTYSNEYRAFVMVEFPPDNAGGRFFTTLPSVFDKAKFKDVNYTTFMGIDSAYKGADSLMVSIVGLATDGERIWTRLMYQEDMKQKYPIWDDRMTTINICLDILKLRDQFGVQSASMDIGFGVQLYETLLRLDGSFSVEPVNFASSPTEWRAESDFNAKWAMNKRAEMHLDLKELCETKMLYIDPPYYDQVAKQMREIGNAEQGQKIRIEAKKDIKRRIGQSPDALDSLCLAVRAMVMSGIFRGANDLKLDDMVYVYGG